ncbi:unnamed protein product [Laminaria digitata]
MNINWYGCDRRYIEAVVQCQHKYDGDAGGSRETQAHYDISQWRHCDLLIRYSTYPNFRNDMQQYAYCVFGPFFDADSLITRRLRTYHSIRFVSVCGADSFSEFLNMYHMLDMIPIPFPVPFPILLSIPLVLSSRVAWVRQPLQPAGRLLLLLHLVVVLRTGRAYPRLGWRKRRLQAPSWRPSPPHPCSNHLQPTN